jgi:hypothetical protein
VKVDVVESNVKVPEIEDPPTVAAFTSKVSKESARAAVV